MVKTIVVFSKKTLTVLLLSVFLLPALAVANGGDQRVLGNKYLINLARSPFTPTAGIKTAMTVSFVDLKTGKLIQDDLLVTVRVGEGRGSRTFIHEEKDLLVKGGILEWSYTFTKHGIHELFFNFSFASDPHNIYEPPDFLLDIQKPKIPVKSSMLILVGIISVLIGGVAGWLIRRKNVPCN